MVIPSRKDCFVLLTQLEVPAHIIRHSIAVGKVALKVAKRLNSHGKKIDLKILEASCLLHDIGKMESINKGGKHELIGSRIVAGHGYREVASVIRKHSLHYILDKKNAPKTLEEKILFYADKRVIGSKVVSLKKRLEYLKKRYSQYRESIDKAEPLVFQLEKELLKR